MASLPTDSLETVRPTELVGVVRQLIGEVERLGKENERLTAALAATKREKEQLKDEIRRLKGLPPRPPMKPSGMEKATDRPAPEGPSATEASPPRRRGPGVSKLSIDRTVTLTAPAQPGSRHKGYEEIIVQDIAFKPECRATSNWGLIHSWCKPPSCNGNIRARSKSTPARPYIARLRVFNLLICPSVWPLLQGSNIAFRTASRSWRIVLAKRCIA